jgi:predicted HAD superfamily Cof-like phosphohydrolase
MKNEQQHVREWMVKAGQATPDRPTMPDHETRVLRIKLIAEELAELCAAFGLRMVLDTRKGKKPKIEIVADDAKPALNFHDLVEAYDGVNDLQVVVLGAAVAMGIECKPGFDEVMRSNDSKFIDGHRREDGKWVKGPSYSPAVLAPIIQAQLVDAHNRDKQQK